MMYLYLLTMAVAVFGWMGFLERDTIKGYVVRPQGKHVLGSPREYEEGRLGEWADILHTLNVNGNYARLARL